MLCTSGFVDDVMFAHNRSGNGDANRAYAKVTHQGAAPGAKSGVYDCLVQLATRSSSQHAPCAAQKNLVISLTSYKK